MSGFINLPATGSASWKNPVATEGDLPASGNTLGDTRMVEDVAVPYMWTGSAWATASASTTNSFTIWQPDLGTAPTANSPTSTMDVTSGDSSVLITGNALLQSLDFRVKNPFTPGNLTSTTSGVTVTGGSGAVSGSGAAVNIATASGSQQGLLSAADWTTFNNKQATMSGSSPIVVGGGVISILQAGTSQNGYLSSSDWNVFNSKQVTVSGSSPISVSGSVISIAQASTSQNGYLSSTDWNTFNNKQATVSGVSPISVSGGSISILQSSSSQNGYLSSTDWTTFNTGASNAPDPVHKLYLFDDFYNAATNIAGTIGWHTIVTGSGASVGVGTSFAGHPGVCGLNTGTTTTGVGGLYLGESVTASLLSDGSISFEMLVEIPNLATVGDDYTIRVGMMDTISGAAPTNGVYFEYTRATNVNWLAVTRSTSTSTSTDTTVAAATGWTKLQWISNAGGTSVDFYVNGVKKVSAQATNVPSTGMLVLYSITKTAGTTNRACYIDYFRLTQTLTTPRL